MAERSYQHGKVALVHGGAEYFIELEKLIRRAKEVLYLEMYIFDEDETGQRILSALIDAAKRKVRVYFLVDGLASYHLGKAFKKKMLEHEILFRHFSPWPFPGITQAGRHLHVKVCVVDGVYALIGGINVSNRYRGVNGELPWLDYALSVEGPVCNEIEFVCQQLWRRRFTRSNKRRPLMMDNGNYPVKVRISLNDWYRRYNQIATGYMRMLRSAEKDIVVIASYFLPGKKMMNALLSTVRRGRKVSVILSQESDVPLVKSAIAYLYPKLLREGVTIYEFKTTILHAKACVIDGEWLSLGSHNLNNLSELMSVEMNLEVLDKKVAGEFATEMQRLIERECHLIKEEELKQTLNIFVKFQWWLSYNLLSLIQRILFLFYRKESVPGKKQ